MSHLYSLLPSGPMANPWNPGFTQEEFAFLKAYLNGHHDNNQSRNPGVPYSTGARSMVIHTQASCSLTASSTGNIAIAITGLLEAPIIVADAVASAVGRTVQYSSISGSGNYASPTSVGTDYMKYHGIESYRCAGLSVKIEDVTPPINQQGIITSCRAPAGFDLVPIETSAADSTQRYARVLDAIPLTEEYIRTMNPSAYVGPSRDGLYAPIPFNSGFPDYVPRDCPAHKACYTSATDPVNVNVVAEAANILAYKTSAGPNLILPTIGASAVPVGASPAGATLVPTSPSTMMTQYVVGSGLSAYTVWRISVMATWEFISGAGSDFAPWLTPPMPTNVGLLTMASETISRMPNAYPAYANFWNEVWKTFKDVYREDLSPIINGVVGSLPPQYAAIGKTATKILDAVTKREEDKRKQSDPVPAELGAQLAIRTPSSNRRPAH